MNTEPISKWRWNEHWSRSIAEAISELEREAQVRFRCYDRWIQEAKVSRVDAWDRQERILSAINHLREYEAILATQAPGASSATATDEAPPNVTRFIA